jgi:hypothetical protein
MLTSQPLNLLTAYQKHLDLSKPKDAAIWAVAVVTFWACRRLGETTVPSEPAFKEDISLFVTRGADITFADIPDFPGTRTAAIPLPWTKSTGPEGGLAIITSRADDLCPLDGFENHLNVNSDVSPESPLFAYKGAKKTYVLTKTAFLNHINHIFKKNGFDEVYGHGFRIGGTVALLLEGMEPESVAKTGGWKSMTFLRYWRRLEDVVPLSTARAYSKTSVMGDLGKLFEHYRIRLNAPADVYDNSDDDDVHNQDEDD